MGSIAVWLPIVTGLGFGILGYRLGYRQATIAAKSLDLDVAKAAPKIRSRAKIERMGENEHDQFVLVITLYNDGEATASQVEGQWRVSASHNIKNTLKIIRLDSLPSFLPYSMEHPISGALSSPLFANPPARVDLNIDLTYVGLNGAKEEYHGTYEYSYEQQDMIPTKGTQSGN